MTKPAEKIPHIRLTHFLRESIACQAMELTRKDFLEDLAVRKKAVATKLYEAVVPADLRKILAGLPKGVVFEIEDDEGDTIYLQYKDGNKYKHSYFWFPKGTRFPHNKKEACIRSGPALKALSEISKLEKARKDLELELLGTLKSFSTVGALLKSWPEIRLVVEKLVDLRPISGAMVVADRKKLNTALGLSSCQS